MSGNIFHDELFEDAHVHITGGSSGVGFGIAKRFAQKGANVSLVARDQEKLDRATRELTEEYDTEALGLSSDVREYERMQEVVDHAAESLGSIDVLVCGAAGNFPASADDMSSNAFTSVIGIDLNGTFNACRAAYEHLTKPGASIIAISAPQSEQPMPFQSHAGAAKAGVDNLMRNLALEWSDDGIRANAIQPGPVADTEGLERLTPGEEFKEKLADALPVGRFVEKEEIGDLCLFLSSPLAECITGAVIPIDCGQMLVGSGAMLEVLS
jgi:NAD(P)-dependent dehydrogenase (short-subunit alcohol dehydrogenase family)